jgi:hypothetical protein
MGLTLGLPSSSVSFFGIRTNLPTLHGSGKCPGAFPPLSLSAAALSSSNVNGVHVATGGIGLCLSSLGGNSFATAWHSPRTHLPGDDPIGPTPRILVDLLQQGFPCDGFGLSYLLLRSLFRHFNRSHKLFNRTFVRPFFSDGPFKFAAGSLQTRTVLGHFR